MENRTTEIARDIGSLQYAHREGGKYAYVKFLSLTRDLSSVLSDASSDAGRLIGEIHERMNFALESRFTEAEERYFYEAKSAVLRLIGDDDAKVRSSAPPEQPPLAQLASAVAAL